MLKEEKIGHPRLGLASQGDEEKDGTKSRGAHGVLRCDTHCDCMNSYAASHNGWVCRLRSLIWLKY